MEQPVLHVNSISINSNRQPIFRGTGVNCINVAEIQNVYTTTVWSSDWNPPPQGEANVPFALLIDPQNQDTQTFNIEVTGEFPFPQNWINLQDQPGFFKIRLNDQNGISLLSEVHAVIDPLNPNPNPNPDNFSAQHFKLQALDNGPILGPFKSGLNWKVSIISCNDLGVPG
jgi:hypothetical protein